MKRVALIIGFIYFITVGIDLGSAVKCYTCNTGIQPACKSDLDDKSIPSLDCPNDQICVTLGMNGTITRACGAEAECAASNKLSGISCTSCKADLCNSDSAGFVPNYATSLGIFFALYTTVKLLI